MTPLLIAVLSSLLAILAAWYQYQDKENEKIEKDIQKKKADDFQTELIKKTLSLDLANSEIKRLQAELIKKTSQLLNESKTVQQIQNESLKFMTGDGPPTLGFFIRSDGTYSPVLFNKTNYPIYDLRFRIDDFDQIIKCRTKIVDDALVIDQDCINKYSQEVGPLFLAPGQSQGFNYYMSRGQTFKHVRIQVITRKQVFIYLCVLYHAEGDQIRFRTRIYTSTKDYRLKLLDENEQGIKPFDQSYWNEHFYADQKVLTGPIQIK